MIERLPEWKLRGSCVGLNLELFFDDYEEDVNAAQFVDKLCSQCPVKKQCLKEGKNLESTGVWGGQYLRLGRYMRSKNRHKGSARMNQEMKELDDI